MKTAGWRRSKTANILFFVLLFHEWEHPVLSDMLLVLAIARSEYCRFS
jgi:hypothetical protein